jgi:peptide deformylase
MLRIVKDNAKSIHSPSKEVTLPLAKEDKALLDEMIAYLRDSQDPKAREENPKLREGIGLAAPQVGVNRRMLVIYYPINEERTEFIQYELVNPKIVVNSLKKCFLAGGEGCLSVDEPHPGKVYRDFRIQVKAYNALIGENVLIKAEGYDAIVLQHEIDHLDGILFYDHIDPKDPEKEIPGSIAIG